MLTLLPNILPVCLFHFSILLSRWNRGQRQSRGRCPHTKRPVTPEKVALRDFLLPVLKMGAAKKYSHRFYSSQYGDFPYFRPFCIDRLGCHSLYPYQSPMAPTTCTRSRRQLQHPSGIDIGTLNIRDDKDFGLAQAIRAVEYVFKMLCYWRTQRPIWRNTPTTD